MKKTCIFFAALLSLALAFTACDNGTTGGGLRGDIVSGNNLAGKLAWLEENAKSGGRYIIEQNADESTEPVVLSYGGKTGITIGLRGVDVNRTVSLSSNGAMFTVGAGVTLVLDNNVTLRGRSDNPVPTPEYPYGMKYIGTVTVSGGTLVMNAGSVITGNKGHGVLINNGTFTMNGGTISSNASSGVWNGGIFTMNGGSISGNTSEDSGGGVWNGGDFTMTGGTISGNTAKVTGTTYGNIIFGGGGVRNGGTFTMRGGSISGNTSALSGGGVLSWGKFTMTGGAISGNVATGAKAPRNFDLSGGGGVFFASASSNDNDSIFFNMSGGSITDNTTPGFGGGLMGGGPFNMSGGSISDNTAGRGGGTAFDRIMTMGPFAVQMTGGTISGNTAAESGGGVHTDLGVFFSMSGGTITGNSAGTLGGGLKVGYHFEKTGGAITGIDSSDGNREGQSNGSSAVYAEFSIGRIQAWRNNGAGPRDNMTFDPDYNKYTGWDTVTQN